jgi:hypothetical protein
VGEAIDIDATEIDVGEAGLDEEELDEEVLLDLRHNLELALALADRIRDEAEGDTVIDRSAAPPP